MKLTVVTLLALMICTSTMGQNQKGDKFLTFGLDLDSWRKSTTNVELNIEYGTYFFNYHSFGLVASSTLRKLPGTDLKNSNGIGIFYRYYLKPFPILYFQPLQVNFYLAELDKWEFSHGTTHGIGLLIPVTEKLAIDLSLSYSFLSSFENIKYEPSSLNSSIRLFILIPKIEKK